MSLSDSRRMTRGCDRDREGNRTVTREILYSNLKCARWVPAAQVFIVSESFFLRQSQLEIARSIDKPGLGSARSLVSSLFFLLFSRRSQWLLIVLLTIKSLSGRLIGTAEKPESRCGGSFKRNETFTRCTASYLVATVQAGVNARNRYWPTFRGSLAHFINTQLATRDNEMKYTSLYSAGNANKAEWVASELWLTRSDMYSLVM